MTEINESYLQIVSALKNTRRAGWLGRGLAADTFADHIFGAMVLGWMMAEKENVDEKKVIELLLVHDFVMAKMEDISPTIGNFAGTYESKVEMEEKTKVIIAEMLPEGLGKTYLSLFDEYQEQKTIESNIALEADKLDSLMQGERFEETTGRNDVLDEYLKTYSKVFKSDTGKKLYNELKVRHLSRKNNDKN